MNREFLMELLKAESSPSSTKNDFKLNKSLITNLIALAILGCGFIAGPYKEAFFAAGSFALSGAITNWIAIHMLFEKVPFLYGSGIVPLKFNEFKKGIKHLIMNQFFTKQNIEKFLVQAGPSTEVDLSSLVEKIDYRIAFDKLVEGIMESNFGTMISMFGGEKSLESIYPKFESKMKEAIIQITQQENVKSHFKNSLENMLSGDSFIGKVEKIIDERLQELTPNMVKEIIQEMIRSHLGWLVVWGGVFGGLIGVIAYGVKAYGIVAVP